MSDIQILESFYNDLKSGITLNEETIIENLIKYDFLVSTSELPSLLGGENHIIYKFDTKKLELIINQLKREEKLKKLLS